MDGDGTGVPAALITITPLGPDGETHTGRRRSGIVRDPCHTPPGPATGAIGPTVHLTIARPTMRHTVLGAVQCMDPATNQAIGRR